MVHPTLAGEVEAAAYQVRMDDKIAIHEVPTRSGATAGIWAWMWPNLAFNVYHDGVMIERMLPEGHAATSIDYLYLRQPENPGFEAAVASSARLMAEDRWICERVQKNLDAGDLPGRRAVAAARGGGRLVPVAGPQGAERVSAPSLRP